VLVATALAAGATPAASAPVRVTGSAGKPNEFGFKLVPKAVKHGAVVFKVTNAGTIPHDFKICASPKGTLANACKGKKTPILAPGKSATLTYTFKTAGKYEYLCTVPSHALAGMKGLLKVT
jgi:nitrite reductase (NO-forming)